MRTPVVLLAVIAFQFSSYSAQALSTDTGWTAQLMAGTPMVDDGEGIGGIARLHAPMLFRLKDDGAPLLDLSGELMGCDSYYTVYRQTYGMAAANVSLNINVFGFANPRRISVLFKMTAGQYWITRETHSLQTDEMLTLDARFRGMFGGMEMNWILAERIPTTMHVALQFGNLDINAFRADGSLDVALHEQWSVSVAYHIIELKSSRSGGATPGGFSTSSDTDVIFEDGGRRWHLLSAGVSYRF